MRYIWLCRSLVILHTKICTSTLFLAHFQEAPIQYNESPASTYSNHLSFKTHVLTTHTYLCTADHNLKVRLDWRENCVESWLLSRDFLYGVFTLPASFFLRDLWRSVARESVWEFSRFYSHWRDQLTTSECQDNMSQKYRIAAALFELSEKE